MPAIKAQVAAWAEKLVSVQQELNLLSLSSGQPRTRWASEST